MNDAESDGAVDDELESRRVNQRQPRYGHTLPREAVVAVEWYSRAQLEYLADKIRKSQSITSLLLPIPKTVMVCYPLSQDTMEQSAALMNHHKKKQHKCTPSYGFKLKSSASDLQNDDTDTNGPPKIASQSIPRHNRTKQEAAEEESAVISIMNSVLDRVVNMEINGFRSAPSTDCAEGQASQKFSITAANLGNAPIVIGTTESGDKYDRQEPSLSLPGTEHQSKCRQPAEKTEGSQALNSTNDETTKNLSVGNTKKLEPQRFHRKKQAITGWQPEYFTLVELHEPEPDITQQRELSDIVKKQVSQRLNQLVVVVRKYDLNLIQRHFHDVSTYGPDMVSAKLESTRIGDVCSKVSPKSQSPLLPKREVNLNETETFHARELVCIEEFDEEEMEHKRELSSLVFKEIRADRSLEEILDGARRLILYVTAIEVKLHNKKAQLMKRKEDFLSKLAELQKSLQQRKRPIEHPQHQSPKRKVPEGRPYVSPSVRPQVVAVAPKKSDPPEEISNAQRMTLAPGTLLRVFPDKLHNDAAQTPRIHVIPAVSTTAQNPSVSFQVHSAPNADSNANDQPVILNARTVVRSANPSRPTVNAPFPLKVLSDTNSEPGATVAQSIRGQTTNVPISMTVDPISNNRHSTSWGSHTRFVPAESNSTSPTSAIPPGYNVSQEGLSQPSFAQSFIWNESDPSLGRVNSRLRQLIRGPSCVVPANKPTSLPRASNSRVVMVSPAQFSALQAQVQQGGPIRIQHVREQVPATFIHLPRFSEEMTVLQPTTMVNVKTQAIATFGSPHQRTANLQPNARPVIINPSPNFQVAGSPSTIAPRFFTVTQASVARRNPGPAN